MSSLGSGGSVDAGAKTQQLEPPFPPSETRDEVDHWPGEPPQETLPTGEETQVLDGEAELGLYGETQLLDEEGEGLALFGETQLLGEGDECEVEVKCDTQIVDDRNEEALALDSNSEDGSQRTEVLQDDDDDRLSDDGATPSVAEGQHISGRFGSNVTSQENAQIATTDLAEQPCEDGLSAHSDSQTNEGGLPGIATSAALLSSSLLHSGSGSMRKSISAVRTTSLRTSGYAATRKLTPESTEVDMRTRNGSHTNHDAEKYNAFVGTQSRAQDVDGKVATTNLEWASILDSDARDLSSKNSSELSDKNKCTHEGDMRHTTCNKRARKLFDDKETDKEDELVSKMNSSIGKADPSEVLDTEFQDNIAPGLSYICSQEPGELSQANALDVVNKLFCVDEIAASPISSVGERIQMISPPVSSVKGAQSLAKSADRSPVRKESTFDWIDANEDESGGDFYNKIKKSILMNDKQLKKPRNQPKTGCPVVGRNLVEGSNCKSTQSKMVSKGLDSCMSDSKIHPNKLLKSGGQLASDKIHQKLFETPLTKPERQNGNNVDFHMNANDTNGIGPDTQVAVEAIEALASGHFVEDMGEIKSIASDPMKSIKRSRQKKIPRKQAIHVSCSSGAENGLRRSKRTKIADASIIGASFGSPLNDSHPTKEVDLVEKVVGSMTLDKMVATEPSLQKAVGTNSNAKKKLENSSLKRGLTETSDARACKTRSVIKRIQTPSSQLLLNQTILKNKTSSPVANHTSSAAEAKVSKENDCYPNISTEPEHDKKLDNTLTKDDARHCDSKYTTPSNKPIDKGSPVCSGLDPRVHLMKSSLRSSVARELIKLQTNDATSPNILQDARRRRDMSSIHILFSRHLDDDIIKHQKKILSRLGVSVATSISDATHFVADKFVRTRNLLEAMAVGKQVVTPMWVESCGQASCFIDEKNYILRDTKKEKEIGFSMPASLASACRKPLLQGKRVFITSTVKPDRETVSCLVKAAGGLPMERIARSLLNDAALLDDLLVISCEEDYAACIQLLEKGVEVYSSELLLNGIVIQKLEYQRHRLFLNHVRRTRSTIWIRSGESNQFHPVGKRK